MLIMFNNTEEIIADFRLGKMVILVDDEDRENEGDLVLAADFVSPRLINFMASQARGMICLALSPEQVDQLRLPLMVNEQQNQSPHKTAFTISIEASSGVKSGISVVDRARTIAVAASPKASPKDVHSPGHVFPIRAKEGGVLERAGHTEASVDLAKLAGLSSAAVICEVLNEHGEVAQMNELEEFALKHNLKIGTIKDLIQYRMRLEK